MKTAKDNYLIVERTTELLKSMSIKDAIKLREAELNSYNNLWSQYSSDCLGHACTFNKLQIIYLKELQTQTL